MRKGQCGTGCEGDHQQDDRGDDDQHGAEAIFPKGCAIFDAVAAAQNVADRLHVAGCGPQSHDGPEPKQRSLPRLQHFGHWFAQGRGYIRWQPTQDIEHRQLSILSLTQQMSDGGGQDEEGEQRQDGKIRKIAGVNEAVVVDADGHAFDDLDRRRARFELLLDLRTEGGAHAGQALAAGFR